MVSYLLLNFAYILPFSFYRCAAVQNPGAAKHSCCGTWGARRRRGPCGGPTPAVPTALSSSSIRPTRNAWKRPSWSCSKLPSSRNASPCPSLCWPTNRTCRPPPSRPSWKKAWAWPQSWAAAWAGPFSPAVRWLGRGWRRAWPACRRWFWNGGVAAADWRAGRRVPLAKRLAAVGATRRSGKYSGRTVIISKWCTVLCMRPCSTEPSLYLYLHHRARCILQRSASGLRIWWINPGPGYVAKWVFTPRPPGLTILCSLAVILYVQYYISWSSDILPPSTHVNTAKASLAKKSANFTFWHSDPVKSGNFLLLLKEIALSDQQRRRL